MTGATFIAEFHRWRGFSRAGGPLGMATTLGFITVSFVPFLLKEWLKTRLDGMKNALKRGRVPEMDCFGEKDS